MSERTTFNETSVDVAGDALLAQYAERVKTLFDASTLPLTGVGGTADNVTATMDPALDGDGLVRGMGAVIEWAGTSTGSVTLTINGGAAVPVLDASGAALVAGALEAGLMSLLQFDGSAWRILSGLSSSTPGVNRQEFAGDGTWIKPTGMSPDTTVRAMLWAGGGAGNATNGGGGGAFVEWVGRLADLGITETVTIGQGGTSGGDGGNTTFGGIAIAYGGHGADASSNPRRGGGAFAMGGASGTFNQTEGGNGQSGDGENAYWGGAGGGGPSKDGGQSVHGGDGGAGASPGEIPGGGGGADAAGARGKAIILVG
jgi:hypothetical protein